MEDWDSDDDISLGSFLVEHNLLPPHLEHTVNVLEDIMPGAAQDGVDQMLGEIDQHIAPAQPHFQITQNTEEDEQVDRTRGADTELAGPTSRRRRFDALTKMFNAKSHQHVYRTTWGYLPASTAVDTCYTYDILDGIYMGTNADNRHGSHIMVYGMTIYGNPTGPGGYNQNLTGITCHIVKVYAGQSVPVFTDFAGRWTSKRYLNNKGVTYWRQQQTFSGNDHPTYVKFNPPLHVFYDGGDPNVGLYFCALFDSYGSKVIPANFESCVTFDINFKSM